MERIKNRKKKGEKEKKKKNKNKRETDRNKAKYANDAFSKLSCIDSHWFPFCRRFIKQIKMFLDSYDEVQMFLNFCWNEA